MNIANRIKEHYESDDFKSLYADFLEQDFANNEADIINRIQDLFNITRYETRNYFESFTTYVDKPTAKKIYDFIAENLENHIRDFSNYYVGSTSLGSITFGEQEEQLDGLHNHKTGKPYDIKYLRKAFEAADFYVDYERNYAYLDLTDTGLHIELCTPELNEYLQTLI